MTILFDNTVKIVEVNIKTEQFIFLFDKIHR